MGPEGPLSRQWSGSVRVETRPLDNLTLTNQGLPSFSAPNSLTDWSHWALCTWSVGQWLVHSSSTDHSPGVAARCHKPASGRHVFSSRSGGLSSGMGTWARTGVIRAGLLEAPRPKLPASPASRCFPQSLLCCRAIVFAASFDITVPLSYPPRGAAHTCHRCPWEAEAGGSGVDWVWMGLPWRAVVASLVTQQVGGQCG